MNRMIWNNFQQYYFTTSFKRWLANVNIVTPIYHVGKFFLLRKTKLSGKFFRAKMILWYTLKGFSVLIYLRCQLNLLRRVSLFYYFEYIFSLFDVLFGKYWLWLIRQEFLSLIQDSVLVYTLTIAQFIIYYNFRCIITHWIV